MQRILVVEDEADIAALVAFNLKRAGYSVTTVHDGGEALELLKRPGAEFDLVVLDLMLPGIHGMDVCRLLRARPATRGIPVIMLTARSEEEDRVRGLEAGADDYLAKPFSPRELVARVKAVLRRGGDRTRPDAVLRLGNLAIDRDGRNVLKRSRPVPLSATEFRLLLYLAERKGRVFSREQLLDAVWQNDAAVEPRTVDVHIRRLRAQVEDDPAEPKIILTRRGMGYYAAEAP